MMRQKMKRIMVLAVCMMGMFCCSQVVRAEMPAYLTEVAPQLPDYYDYVNRPFMDKNGTVRITWWSAISSTDEYLPNISYEVEIAKNKQFKDATKFESKETSLAIPKSFFGKNGGKYYVHVRTRVNADMGTSMYSAWSVTEEYTFVAINKKNFPGLYEVLKKGGNYNSVDGIKTEIYDTNKDGWLDYKEITDITSIHTMDVTKKKKGKTTTVKAPNVSSVKGIEYLMNLSTLSLERYSGKTMDLSKNDISLVWIDCINAKQFTLNAPDASTIHVEANPNVKMNKMDFSKCNKAVDISAYGSKGTKTLKLPKTKKNLKILSLSDINIKTLNMNSYTNLQQLYVYSCNYKEVSVNKCKNLRYIYFYFCDNMKSLNLKSNKKLRGADFYACKGLTKQTVKRPKNGKCTWNKGKWWYDTAKYQRDMEEIARMKI